MPMKDAYLMDTHKGKSMLIHINVATTCRNLIVYHFNSDIVNSTKLYINHKMIISMWFHNTLCTHQCMQCLPKVKDIEK